MFGRRFAQNALNWLFGKTPAATPAGVVWLSLHTASPGEDGQTANEVSTGGGSGYARKATIASDWVAATLADPSVIANGTLLAFAQATANWAASANLTHVGFWMHATSTTEANFLGASALTTPRAVLSGDTPEFAIGVIQITLD